MSSAFGHVLVTHDWLVTWGGAEQCLAQILEIVPSARVVVGVRGGAMRDFNPICQRAEETWLGRIPGAGTHYQWLVALEAVAFEMLDVADADVVISSSHAFAKSVRAGRRGIHLSYCYSPPRYLWDLYQTYASRTSWVRRLALSTALRPMRWLDRRSARGVTHFVAISQFVADRIQRCYGRRSRVVYPPVTRKAGPPGPSANGREDYLLYLGRLVPYKRVDLLVQAARLTGMRTVIAGDGPERRNLERMAGPTVEFVGRVDNQTASHLMDHCAAFVFCAEEDFGIAPLEANAHGAPVVALRAGAARETMVEGVSAEFFDYPTVESLVPSLRRALDRSWDAGELRENAARFTPERFAHAFRSVLEAAVGGERW